MKFLTLLLTSLIVSQAVNADHRCEDYITDEWPNSRYTIDTISGDGVVTDKKTRLMWQKCGVGVSGNDCSTGGLTSLSWQESMDLASTSDFAGFSNWRVPNIKELRTIVARNCAILSINESVFPLTGLSNYWTSSPVASNDAYGWLIGFGYGYDDRRPRTSRTAVRFVRDL